MLIGELSRRTGVSERLLRYYERTGLIHAERRANGYREYDGRTVETVRQVRALLAVGLPTRVIRQVLPCTYDTAMLRPCPGVLTHLRDRLSVLDRRAAELDAARHLLRRTIAATEHTENVKNAENATTAENAITAERTEPTEQAAHARAAHATDTG